MNNSWLFFAIISGLCSVGFNFINRYVLKDNHDSTAYSWWFEFFRFLIFIPFAILWLNQVFIPSNLVLFLAIGLVEFLAIYFYMKMHSKSELSISTTVSQLRLVWVPIIALIFLKETLGFWEYIGILLIFAGQVVTTFKKDFNWDSGVKYAFISTFFVSANNVLVKEASGRFFPAIVLIAMALPSLFIFPLKMKNGFSRLINLGKTKWRNVFLAALFNAGTMVFMLKAFKLGEVGKVTAIFQSVMVIQVVLGILFLHENKNVWRKIIGILTVLAGVLLLI